MIVRKVKCWVECGEVGSSIYDGPMCDFVDRSFIAR